MSNLQKLIEKRKKLDREIEQAQSLEKHKNRIAAQAILACERNPLAIQLPEETILAAFSTALKSCVEQSGLPQA